MHKLQNIAAVIRTCDGVGIDKIHVTIPKEGYRQHHGTAKGSTKLVGVERHMTIESAVATVKQQGMQVVAAHFSERAVDYREFDFTQPTALVLGAEKFGISETAAELADAHVTIPCTEWLNLLMSPWRWYVSNSPSA